MATRGRRRTVQTGREWYGTLHLPMAEGEILLRLAEERGLNACGFIVAAVRIAMRAAMAMDEKVTP